MIFLWILRHHSNHEKLSMDSVMDVDDENSIRNRHHHVWNEMVMSLFVRLVSMNLKENE